MQNFNMLLGIWEELGNLITGLFAIIPQSLYFIYASAASLLDMLQFAMRKLAGLDVYYLNGEAQSGDILTSFIEGIVGINSNYSALSTVFWSMVIFGVVLLIFATIITMIKTHYDYDAKKSAPSYIIGKAIRGLLTMVIIPITTIFALYLSEILLKTLDIITTGSSGMTLSDTYESGALEKFDKEIINDETVYTSFDFFGSTYWTNSYCFSGSLFRSATYNCNRLRTGNFTAVVGENNTNWSNAGVFWTDNASETKEVLANQVDTAFEYSLRLKEGQLLDTFGSDSYSLLTSYSNQLSAIYSLDLINVKCFSKFKTGLVFYYYDLWAFDFFIGYAGIITALTLFINIILGLVKRLFYLIVIFLVYPPITALFPFDDGQAVKTWRTSFTKMYLAVYGSVVAVNLMCIILPFLRSITFFNIALLDILITSLMVLAGLTMIKKIIALLSGLIGADNLEAIGGKIAKEFKENAAKAVAGVMALAGVGIKAGGILATKTKNRFVRKKLKMSPFAKVTKADRDKYDALRKQEKADKAKAKYDKKVDELAEKKLEESRSKAKDPRQSEYSKRAKEQLKKQNPELWKKRGKSKHKEEYQKALIQMEKELAKQDAISEIGEKKPPLTQRAKDGVKNFFYQPAQSSKKTNDGGGDSGDGGEPPKRQLKQPFQDFVDLGGKTLKFAGDLTGIQGFGKAIEEAGGKNNFIEAVQSFAKITGSSLPESLKTKKQKDAEDEDAEDEEVKGMKARITYQEETSTEISNLTLRFQNLYKAVQERDEKSKRKAAAEAKAKASSEKKNSSPPPTPAGGGGK